MTSMLNCKMQYTCHVSKGREQQNDQPSLLYAEWVSCIMHNPDTGPDRTMQTQTTDSRSYIVQMMLTIFVTQV